MERRNVRVSTSVGLDGPDVVSVRENDNSVTPAGLETAVAHGGERHGVGIIVGDFPLERGQARGSGFTYVDKSLPYVEQR